MPATLLGRLCPEREAVQRSRRVPPVRFPANLTRDENEPISRVYFPIDGVISIVSLTEEGDIAESYTGGRDGAFSRAIHLYLHWLIGFTGQSAACKLHGLTERCARWLLITNDRADRARLEEASCPCYRIVANEFKRVLGGP